MRGPNYHSFISLKGEIVELEFRNWGNFQVTTPRANPQMGRKICAPQKGKDLKFRDDAIFRGFLVRMTSNYFNAL